MQVGAGEEILVLLQALFGQIQVTRYKGLAGEERLGQTRLGFGLADAILSRCWYLVVTTR